MMRALFSVSLMELLLGGGGRLLAVGPVSLRMVLFCICLGATLLAVLFPRRRADGLLLAVLLVLAYLVIHIGALFVGAIYSGDTPKMLTEFQQSLYWLAAPFFALMIQTEEDVRKAARLVLAAGVGLACVYITILLGLLTGVLPLSLLKSVVQKSGEFLFRGGEFFVYKGFLYLGIAIVFLVALRGRFWRTLVVLVGAAMVLTFTRGFLVSACASVLAMLCTQRRWKVVIPALVLMTAAVAFIWIYLPSADESAATRYEASSNQRLEDLAYIRDHISVKTFLIGEGYASLINNRYLIENTFLWALWKLGTLGLVFWLTPLVLCIHYYLKIPDRAGNPLASAFLFGTVLVYVQTNTNPYLNNPIGLSFVILALFSLRTLSRCGTGNAAAQAVRAEPPPLLLERPAHES
jgi:hypothetical protein